ncbi:hypothetical protein [Naumannella halotolerans]|uniref:GIY-YIG domain-containing protein n=1 Tax=Naumannella halotolerans TaxID=993414 RepID=A0A4R7J1S9_9ACTN|nr:hypothetical protein [Naumannella halotolerans]TDT31112.1 hypothetical protein CLV29_2525 [Naumannella halotolerans]
MSDTDTSTSVYRYYDRHKVLLYVGVTARGVSRNNEHNSKPWWGFVSSQKIEHYQTRKEALSRESLLITEFQPPFNVQQNPASELARRAYMQHVATAAPDAPAAHEMPKWLTAGITKQGRIVIVSATGGGVLKFVRNEGKPSVTGKGSVIEHVGHDGTALNIRVRGNGWESATGARIMLGYPTGKVVIKRIEAITT